MFLVLILLNKNCPWIELTWYGFVFFITKRGQIFQTKFLYHWLNVVVKELSHFQLYWWKQRFVFKDSVYSPAWTIEEVFIDRKKILAIKLICLARHEDGHKFRTKLAIGVRQISICTTKTKLNSSLSIVLKNFETICGKDKICRFIK